MRSHFSVAVALVALCGARPVVANNTLFLPGDAFFHTVLTEDHLKELPAQENPRFGYGRPELGRAGCGYAGFAELEFTKMPRDFKANLRRAYYGLRKERSKIVALVDDAKTAKPPSKFPYYPRPDRPDRKVQQELNGFSVFFYNESFDFTRHKLALRYNERWVEETEAFGYKREHIRLETFVFTRHAILEEWRDAKHVEALKVDCPEPSRGSGDKEGGKPSPLGVRATGGLKALVLDYPVIEDRTDQFRDYFERVEGITLLEVTDKGLRRHVVKDGKWTVAEGKEPRDGEEGASFQPEATTDRVRK
jgi:hypothetical protein